LLRGDRPFVLPIGSAGAKITGKVEKGYALKTSELQLHVFREGLAGYTTNELHKELVATAYLAGMEIEFAKIDKPHVTHRYAFVTVATPVSREALLTRPFKIEGMSFTFNTPIPAAEKQQNKESGDKDTRITTTIVITGISRDYGQAEVSNSIRNLIGADNIVLMSYGHAKFDAQGRHKGTCYVQLTNAIVYTQGSRMRPMKLIGNKIVHFKPHQKSMDGATATIASKDMAEPSTQKALANTVQMMKNIQKQNPPMMAKDISGLI
jgi:hypothetical protein